ncbi:MAG: hypothetical protein WC441_00445 [Patescibacteria group bacterium]
MINRKRAIILVVVLGLLIIAFIIYWVWFRRPITLGPSVETPVSPGSLPVEISTSTPGSKPRNYQNYDISKEAPHEINANDLGKLGMTFAERFGSFSKQSNYGNIEDAKLFMTSDLRDWADTYLDKLKEENKDKDYYDIVTKATSFEVSSFDAKSGQGSIVIKTLRKESTEAVNNGKEYPQSLTLDFKKVGDSWLIDAAYWGKK